MIPRVSKVRRTDYRAAPVAETREDRDHDKMVALFELVTLRRMETDLSKRRLQFSGSPENRWAAARLAAIRRRLNLQNLQKP